MRRNTEIKSVHSDISVITEVQWCNQIRSLITVAVIENGTHSRGTFFVVVFVAVLRWELKPLSLYYKSTSYRTFLLVNNISQIEGYNLLLSLFGVM